MKRTAASKAAARTQPRRAITAFHRLVQGFTATFLYRIPNLRAVIDREAICRRGPGLSVSPGGGAERRSLRFEHDEDEGFSCESMKGPPEDYRKGVGRKGGASPLIEVWTYR